MTIQLEIPDDLRDRVIPFDQEPARAGLEALALEGYRAGRLSQYQVQRLLGFGTRMEVDGFLKEHGVWLEYTMEDFHREGDLT